jgi:uncharacterized membrane protein YcaP (DUF421 family)
MKFIAVLLIFAAAFLALFEQSKSHPNVIVMVVAFVLFMAGLMRIMAKVPSRNNDQNENDDVQSGR